MKKYLLFIVVCALAVVVAPFAPMARAVGEDLSWTSHFAGNGTYRDVEWSPELGLFVAVSNSTNASTSFTAVSQDGENWTTQPTTAGNGWSGIAWSPELGMFAAVAWQGTDLVMTSTDGENWTTHSGQSGQWEAVTWSSELGIFVAVASNLDSSDQVMTSSDGVNWTAHESAATHNWFDVTWSPELNLFVAVGNDREIMTSSDGENWTAYTTPASWFNSVEWSPELGIFVAVTSGGSGSPNVITSSDGMNWTGYDAVPGFWEAVTWSPEKGMFLAVAHEVLNPDHHIMASTDGVTWNELSSVAEDNYWQDVVWSPELQKFVAVGNNGTNRVMSAGSAVVAPSAPTNLYATVINEKEIQLSWNAPAGSSLVSGYMIERSVDGGPFTALVANTNSTNTTYTDTEVEPGITYTYRVSAINTTGTGDPSNPVSATINEEVEAMPTVPTTPTTPTAPAGETTSDAPVLAATGANTTFYLLGGAAFILLSIAIILQNRVGLFIRIFSRK